MKRDEAVTFVKSAEMDECKRRSLLEKLAGFGKVNFCNKCFSVDLNMANGCVRGFTHVDCGGYVHVFRETVSF